MGSDGDGHGLCIGIRRRISAWYWSARNSSGPEIVEWTSDKLGRYYRFQLCRDYLYGVTRRDEYVSRSKSRSMEIQRQLSGRSDGVLSRASNERNKTSSHRLALTNEKTLASKSCHSILLTDLSTISEDASTLCSPP